MKKFLIGVGIGIVALLCLAAGTLTKTARFDNVETAKIWFQNNTNFQINWNGGVMQVFDASSQTLSMKMRNADAVTAQWGLDSSDAFFITPSLGSIKVNGGVRLSSTANVLADDGVNLTYAGVPIVPSTNGIVANPNNALFIFEGDSLTALANTNAYASILGNVNSAWNSISKTNFATTGNGWTDLSNRWTSTVGPYITANSGKKVFLSVWCGANDYSFFTNPTDTINKMSNYLATAKAAGVTLVSFTVMPRTAFNGLTDMGITNLWMVNQFARTNAFWDYLVDVASMFPNCLDTKMFSDGTHLTTPAQLLLAREFDSVLRAPPHRFRSAVSTQAGTNSFEINSANQITGRSAPDSSWRQFGGQVEVVSNLFVFNPQGRRFSLNVTGTGALAAVMNDTNTLMSVGNPESWFVADDWNASTFTLPDRVQGWNLVAVNSAHLPVYGAGLNSFHTLFWTNANTVPDLANTSFTNAGTQEIWIVISNRVATATSKYIFDSRDGSFRHYSLDQSNTNSLRVGLGTGSLDGGQTLDMTVGVWHTLTYVYNGVNLALYTNNVLYASSSSATANAMNGLTLGGSFNDSSSSSMEIAEWVSYSAINTSQNRTAIYNYFKNKYASTNTGVFAWP
jgi:hypothetical protein